MKAFLLDSSDLINKLNPFFWKIVYLWFLCLKRKYKHTLLGLRINSFIKNDINQNFSYLFKLDLDGFFMNINKDILFKKSQNFINRYYNDNYNKIFILEQSHIIIFNNPIKDCCIKVYRLGFLSIIIHIISKKRYYIKFLKVCISLFI